MHSRSLILVLLMTVAHAPSLLIAEEPPASELTEFTSAAGKFSILLPGEPMYEKTQLGGSSEVQHQYKIGGADGVYLISFQENPNLKGSSPEQLAAALESGRDRLVQVFQGEVVESKNIPLAKKHSGLSFRVTIPQAGGEARCRFYMVGTRLYQVMAIGKPDFVSSEESARVLDSFKLLP